MVYAVPIEHGRFLIFSPHARAAFIGNRAAAIALRELRAGRRDASTDRDLETFFDDLGLLIAERAPRVPTPSTLCLRLVLGCLDHAEPVGGTPSLSSDQARAAIDEVVERAARLNVHTIRLTYVTADQSIEANRLVRSSLDHAQQACSRRALQLHVAVELAEAPSQAAISWISAYADTVLLRIESSSESDCVIDDHELGKRLASKFLVVTKLFEVALVPYSFCVSLPMFRARTIAVVIRLLSQSTKPTQIEVDPLAPGDTLHAQVCREATELASALNRVRPLCDEIGCELVVPGAMLERPMALCGSAPGEYAVSPDGKLTAFAEGPLDRRGCDGCFAEHHCLGGLHSDRADNAAFPGSARCHLAREVSKDTLLSRISRANGVAWSGAPLDTLRKAAPMG